jgi:hypothetical protein
VTTSKRGGFFRTALASDRSAPNEGLASCRSPFAPRMKLLTNIHGGGLLTERRGQNFGKVLR